MKWCRPHGKTATGRGLSEHMKQKVQALLQQDFIRHNAVFFLGTLGISLFNYLYYPVIGRLASVSEFGEIQALISLFMELGIVLTVFGYITTNIVNNHNDKSNKVILLTELERLALFITVALFGILLIGSFYLKSSLQFTSVIPLIGVGALIVLNVPSTFRTYYLQGEKHLKEVSISGIIFAAGKLALSAALIIVGWNVFGAIAGYIIAQAATLYYVASKTHGKLPSVRSSIPVRMEGLKFQTERKVLKRELLFGCVILVLLATVTVLYTSDAIIVRRFFSATEAGFFSGLSAVARIVFFVTASVAGVLIASIKISNTARENHRTLVKSLVLVSLIGGVALVVFSLFPRLITSILIGGDYVKYAYLLPWMSLSMLLCSYNNLLFSYQIALRDYSSLFAAGVGAVLLPILVITNHATLLHIAYDYVICNLAIFVIACIQIFRTGEKHV